MTEHTQGDQPNPNFIFETLNSYQRTMALRAAIELEVFTAIAEGNVSAPTIAARCHATERGVRMLCDYLSIAGLLSKKESHYTLGKDAAVFLDERSPAYIGTIADFLIRPETMEVFMDLPATIRDPEASLSGRSAMEPENPHWVKFARAMAPIMRLPAQLIAEMVCGAPAKDCKVLDVAAGHGIFGITIAKYNPKAEIFALDWPSVLEVAKENAKAAGVGPRHHLLPGSFFDRDLGAGYDLVLITNFMHHFDVATNENILRKVHDALAPDARVVVLDFVPNDDRVTPPLAAAFAMTMLGHTQAGDAYTFAEYESMFRNAGYSGSEIRPLPGPMSVIISRA